MRRLFWANCPPDQPQGKALIGATNRASPAEAAAQTTLDHLAFTVAREDFDHVRGRLEASRCRLKFANHDWVHWPPLYPDDPEGNNVEFVCYDPTV